MKTEITEPDEYFLVGQNETRQVIYLRYPLFKALDDFATRESHREQVGLLVGRASQRADGTTYMLVEDAIESPIGDENVGRFDESLWKRARRIAAARHPNRTVVGWFHTVSHGDLNLTTEEQSVHKRFFPEEHQVLYRIDPKAKDRMFYIKESGALKAASGFCIYGKPSAESVSAEAAVPPVSGAKSTVTSVAASPEQQQRYLERSLEKIHRRLQRPPVGPKDIAIMALLVANGLIMWFRPTPKTEVNVQGLERSQAEISAQVTEVRDRIGKLEQHLADLQLLDQQLKLAAGMEEIEGARPEGEESPFPEDLSSPQTPAAGETPGSKGDLAGGAGKVTLYKVVANDTLSKITQKFYPEAGPDVTASFARFNRLQAPEFAIFPGDVLKIPDEKALH